MRCSLLTLSTYVDGELTPDRAGELEAHLVACQRCSDGLGYLREEQQHIRRLAPVHAGANSTNELLAVVGIAMPAPQTEVAKPAATSQFLLDLAESPTPAPAEVANGAGEHDSLIELNGSHSKQPDAAAAAEVADAQTALPPGETVRFESDHFETRLEDEPAHVAPVISEPSDGEPASAEALDPEPVQSELAAPEPQQIDIASLTDGTEPADATMLTAEPETADVDPTVAEEELGSPAAADPDADAVDAWLAAGQDVVIPESVPAAPPEWSGEFAASMRAPSLAPPAVEEPAPEVPPNEETPPAAVEESTPEAIDESPPTATAASPQAVSEDRPPAAIEEVLPAAIDEAPPAPPPDLLPQTAAREEFPRPPQPSIPPAPPPLGPAQGARGASWFDRARDAVALRFALMKGSRPDEDLEEEGIQIVSGAGAPSRPELRQRRPVTEAVMPSVDHQQRTEEPSASESLAAESRAPAAGAPDTRAFETRAPETRAPEPLAPDWIPPAIPFRDFDLPREPAEFADTPKSIRSRGAFQPYDHFEAPLTFETSMPETAEEPEEAEVVETAPPIRPQPAAEASAEAPEAGRHTRAVHGERRSLKLPAFGIPKPRPRSKRTPVPGPFSDRRLWIFGSAVVVLALVGLLIGKSTTLPAHRTNGAVPNPTAIALPSAPALSSPAPSAASTPAATPQATPQPTPTATPAPTPANTAPNPNNLTGAQTLGAGGSGFAVQDVRYGEHPNDFRIVYDLSGNGSPTTTVGFGNPTTLYVIFDGTTGSGQPAQPPAGQTATAVKLLSPSPVAGKTVYEITLSIAAKLTTSYLQGPARLVIDLG